MKGEEHILKSEEWFLVKIPSFKSMSTSQMLSMIQINS